MYAGGELLERFRRAPRPPRDDRAARPRAALRHAHRDGRLEQVAIETLVPAIVVLVRRATSFRSTARSHAAAGVLLDQSALTGEALPVRQGRRHAVSGSTNVGEAFDLIVARARGREAPTPASSAGARRRRTQGADVERIADRFAIWFLVVTLAIAGGAWLSAATASALWPCSSWRRRAR